MEFSVMFFSSSSPYISKSFQLLSKYVCEETWHLWCCNLNPENCWDLQNDTSHTERMGVFTDETKVFSRLRSHTFIDHEALCGGYSLRSVCSEQAGKKTAHYIISHHPSKRENGILFTFNFYLPSFAILYNFFTCSSIPGICIWKVYVHAD